MRPSRPNSGLGATEDGSDSRPWSTFTRSRLHFVTRGGRRGLLLLTCREPCHNERTPLVGRTFCGSHTRGRRSARGHSQRHLRAPLSAGPQYPRTCSLRCLSQLAPAPGGRLGGACGAAAAASGGRATARPASVSSDATPLRRPGPPPALARLLHVDDRARASSGRPFRRPPAALPPGTSGRGDHAHRPQPTARSAGRSWRARARRSSLARTLSGPSRSGTRPHPEPTGGRRWGRVTGRDDPRGMGSRALPPEGPSCARSAAASERSSRAAVSPGGSLRAIQ